MPVSLVADNPGNSVNPAWTVEQVMFQRWLALPKRMREPGTQIALAIELKVDVATLWRWKQLLGWDDAVRVEVRDSVFQSPGVQQKVLEALVKEAVKGSYYHQRLYLEMAGIYNPKGAAVASVTILYGVDQEDV